MTNPFAVNPSNSVIQTPGAGGIAAQGILGVLAAMQAGKEMQFRQAELANAVAQQQALQAYYEGQMRQQQDELNYKAGSDAIARAGQRQVGAAMRNALLGGAPPTPQQPAQPGTLSGGMPGPQPGSNPNTDPSAGVFQQLIGSAAQAVDPFMQRALQGVDDENVPAAVDAVRGLQPKATDLPTAGKEFMFAQQLAQVDPRLAKFFIDNWVNKGPQTVVNNIPAKAQTAFAVEDAKAQAGALAKAEEAARGASSAMPSISEAYGILSNGKAYVGLGAKQKLFAGRVAAALGVPSAQVRTEKTQTLWRLAGETTLSYLRSRDLGSGTAVSDADRNYMAGLAGQDLTLEPVALRRIMRINFGAQLMKQADAIAQLKARAQGNPDMAAELGRRARSITRQYETAWTTYARMLAREGVTEDDIRQRMVDGGIQDPEPLLRDLPQPPTVQQEADSIMKAFRRPR